MDSRAIISACKIMDVGGDSVQKGSQSFKFDIPVYIEQTASVVGEKESEGPLGRMFDVVIKDPMSGKDNWEQAESALQEAVVDKLLMKTSYKKEQIRYILSGDLLGQLIATSFGISKYEIPHFGIYGACSTFGEALSLGALIISAGAADRLICMASSHFASAEKQFRFPLEYGNQRPKASTWSGSYYKREAACGHYRYYNGKNNRLWCQRFNEYGCLHGTGSCRPYCGKF